MVAQLTAAAGMKAGIMAEMGIETEPGLRYGMEAGMECWLGSDMEGTLRSDIEKLGFELRLMELVMETRIGSRMRTGM